MHPGLLHLLNTCFIRINSPSCPIPSIKAHSGLVLSPLRLGAQNEHIMILWDKMWFELQELGRNYVFTKTINSVSGEKVSSDQTRHQRFSHLWEPPGLSGFRRAELDPFHFLFQQMTSSTSSSGSRPWPNAWVAWVCSM